MIASVKPASRIRNIGVSLVQSLGRIRWVRQPNKTFRVIRDVQSPCILLRTIETSISIVLRRISLIKNSYFLGIINWQNVKDWLIFDIAEPPKYVLVEFQKLRPNQR